MLHHQKTPLTRFLPMKNPQFGGQCRLDPTWGAMQQVPADKCLYGQRRLRLGAAAVSAKQRAAVQDTLPRCYAWAIAWAESAWRGSSEGADGRARLCLCPQQGGQGRRRATLLGRTSPPFLLYCGSPYTLVSDTACCRKDVHSRQRPWAALCVHDTAAHPGDRDAKPKARSRSRARAANRLSERASQRCGHSAIASQAARVGVLCGSGRGCPGGQRARGMPLQTHARWGPSHERWRMWRWMICGVYGAQQKAQRLVRRSVWYILLEARGGRSTRGWQQPRGKKQGWGRRGELYCRRVWSLGSGQAVAAGPLGAGFKGWQSLALGAHQGRRAEGQGHSRARRWAEASWWQQSRRGVAPALGAASGGTASAGW